MSKKTIAITVLVVCVMAVFLFVFGAAGKKPVNYPPKGNTVVAFGDSLVWGEGATPGNDLSALISGKVGVPIVNLGKSGDTTGGALNRINEAISLKPDVAMILLGGNDALRRVPIVETEANLHSIVSLFQKAGAVTIVLGVRGGLLGDPYESMYKRVSDDTGSVYVKDVLSGIFGKDEYMSDSIHPNDKGYAVIAARVAPILSKILDHRY